jgi:hypothetical protein
VSRLYLALYLLLGSFLGRAQTPPAPPEAAAFQSLISILQKPDLARWYALHPADPEPVYRAGLRGGGSTRDFIGQSPEDTPRVACLYRQYLLVKLLDNLWSVFGRGLDLTNFPLPT